jgi:hypothetical protein
MAAGRSRAGSAAPNCAGAGRHAITMQDTTGPTGRHAGARIDRGRGGATSRRGSVESESCRCDPLLRPDTRGSVPLPRVDSGDLLLADRVGRRPRRCQCGNYFFPRGARPAVLSGFSRGNRVPVCRASPRPAFSPPAAHRLTPRASGAGTATPRGESGLDGAVRGDPNRSGPVRSFSLSRVWRMNIHRFRRARAP